MDMLHKLKEKERGIFVSRNDEKHKKGACIFIQAVLQFGYTSKTPVLIGGTYHG